ncbi:MAG: (2Fe-2S)-binding protein [Spirochaetes bacterium]|jgi:[NiFe] hydrogenase diaphorase moiety small subunit|nr:(2Fe-2S)-binding protein [Spirochaetota bacterium]
MSEIKFTIDGKECAAKAGQTIVEAARDNGVYIPTLCHYEGIKPAGACRVCTVRVGGRNMAACTTPVANGMVIENKTDELEDMRKAIIEMLFVEGNHMCPVCEKSGNCELQALAYRYTMLAPRFPYLWPRRGVDASMPKLYKDGNRCIQCLRCVRGVTAADGRKVFGLVNRGGRVRISHDAELSNALTDEQARRAMDLCPVGALIRKEVGYAVPIGKRKYDSAPIGGDVERA